MARTVARSVCATLALASLAVGARADVPENDTGVSLTLLAGSSSIEDRDGIDTFDGSDLGFSLDGEWRFLRYLGLGFSMTDFGEDTDQFNGTATTIGVDGFGFFLRGYLPVNERIVLHARVGGFSYNSDVDPGVTTVFPFSDSADEWGVGADFRITQGWAVRVEHRELDGDNAEEGSLTGIGVSYQF